MKYLVNVIVTQTYSIELSAKDEAVAMDKAEKAFDKLPRGIAIIDLGKFDMEEDIDYEAEEL